MSGLDFECLETGLHLQPFAVSCGHVTVFFLLLFGKTGPEPAIGLLNDYDKKEYKVRSVTWMTCFMIISMDRLHYGHSLSTTCTVEKMCIGSLSFELQL